MKNFNKFLERMKSIDINLECSGNYPWVYIDRINGKRVTELFMAEHGFTIGFQKANNGFRFTDMKEIFKLIRRYTREESSMEIKIEINSCQDCPKWRRARFWTSDSWEEAYDWFCTACKDKDDPSQDRKIQGYVEWHDVKGITIPAWCPNKL